MVSEKKSFSCIFTLLACDRQWRPWDRVCMDPRGTVGRIYKEVRYTMLWSVLFSEKFLCFSHCKAMGADDPQGGAILTPGA